MARLLLPTLLLLAALCVPPTAFAQEGPPPPPHAFFGEVTVNGQPVPVGASVEGRGEGIRTGLPGNPITISEPGRYGGPSVREPKLVAQGWVAEGLALTFYVDGVRAECAPPGGAWGESFPFQPGGVTPLNLRVGSAPAAPSSPTDPAAEQQAPPSAVHAGSNPISDAARNRDRPGSAERTGPGDAGSHLAAHGDDRQHRAGGGIVANVCSSSPGAGGSAACARPRAAGGEHRR